MESGVTMIIRGGHGDNDENTTTIKRKDGKEMRFYHDGYYDGISPIQLKEILDFLGIEYFEVHKN